MSRQVRAVARLRERQADAPSVTKTLQTLQSEHVHVRQERCLLVRNRNAECLRCAQACTSGCISYDEGTRALTIDQAKCVGCSTCATACPTCALEAREPNDTELLARLHGTLESTGEGERTITIACERARVFLQEQDSSMRLTCLGRIDESALVQLAAWGAREIELICGTCDTCEHKPGRTVAEDVIDTANTLFRLWGSDAHVNLRSTESIEPASEAGARGPQDSLTDRVGENGDVTAPRDLAPQDPPLERRDEAEGAATPDARGVQDAPLEQAGWPAWRLKVMADSTLPHFVPDRRERLLDALAELGEGPADSTTPARTRLWGHVVIDPEKCTSCRMCATFCPTGAIVKFDEADGTFGVDHYPADCVKCLCCQAICRAKAITVEDDVPANVLVHAVPERYVMRPVRVPKGGVHSIMNSMRDLLGLPEVFER